MIKIAMLSTGEEVLHGDIDDTNASWLSALFYEHGYELSYRATVGDQHQSLVEELQSLGNRFDVVIVNGGLGPTTDDLSAACAATAANSSLVLFKEWLIAMEGKFEARGLKMPESNLKQAMLPKEASILDNPIGTACGFEMVIGKAKMFFTPGVPSEFKHMVQGEILPRLAEQYTDIDVHECSRIYTFGMSESGISDKLDLLKLPSEYQLGYRSYLPFIEVKLFGPADDMVTRMQWLKIIYSHLEDAVVSVDEPMLDNVANLMNESNTTLSVAEQASGGFLANWLHDNDELAERIRLGWIMSPAMTTQIADKEPLAAALALAGACRDNGKSDFGLACGLIEEGTFAVALATPQGEWGQVMTFNREYARKPMRSLMATLMLDMLRRHLESKPMFGQYGSFTRQKELFVPASQI
ncbi:CinA family nicotinamide mononucleotide deamidase-related protein [Vibrio sp. SCSIO 43136]|uniref:CinA family nicotinamide mononucleotide deamidase-related protein n=1 Tax=Vibrio sp. SCSIO 43136 TaxID=2819101 RepID=UPI00207666A3|nr:CinA family nicotinamide mononucleotide deamidase-related protein [Vibrio sp. SCSIO 43136]USD66371.1 CinA family nicotinamide mononucleotide deamidase-related protein [Vibrio sp. SCSIO 43136]